MGIVICIGAMVTIIAISNYTLDATIVSKVVVEDDKDKKASAAV
jgi:hypothetical protein